MSICHDDVESVDYLFGLCSLLVPIWRMVAKWWDVASLDSSTIQNLLSWSESVKMGAVNRKMFDAVVRVTSCLTWRLSSYTFNRKSDVAATQMIMELLSPVEKQLPLIDLDVETSSSGQTEK